MCLLVGDSVIHRCPALSPWHLLDSSHACLGLMLRFYWAVCLQVTHTALATPEVLARLCPAANASPFQRLIRDLLLFFAATYKVRWAAPSGLMHTSAKCAILFAAICTRCPLGVCPIARWSTHAVAPLPKRLQVYKAFMQKPVQRCLGARLMANAVENLAPSPQDVFGFDSPPLHDPTAVAYVIDPSLFQVGPDVACCGYA